MDIAEKSTEAHDLETFLAKPSHGKTVQLFPSVTIQQPHALEHIEYALGRGVGIGRDENEFLDAARIKLLVPRDALERVQFTLVVDSLQEA